MARLATRERPPVTIVDEAGATRSGLPASRPDLASALSRRPLPVPVSRDLPARYGPASREYPGVRLGAPDPSLAPVVAFTAIGVAGALIAAFALAAILAVVWITTAAVGALVALAPFALIAAVLAAVGIAYGNRYSTGHVGCESSGCPRCGR